MAQVKLSSDILPQVSYDNLLVSGQVSTFAISTPLDTMIYSVPGRIFYKVIFLFKKVNRRQQKHEKLPRLQRTKDRFFYFLFSVKLFVCSEAYESVSEIADLIREAIEKN